MGGVALIGAVIRWDEIMGRFAVFGLGVVVTAAAMFGVAACTDPGLDEPVEVPVEVAPVEPVEVADPVQVTRDMFTGDGMAVGDVIVCAEGMEVSVDVTPDGVTWAACM